MNKYNYKDLVIEVYDDPTYKAGSEDNRYHYQKQHFGNSGSEYATSKHGVKIYREEEETNNCIVIGSGGSTGIYKNSSIIDNDQLLICCCDTIFCLSLPDLGLKWATQSDQATCFGIYKLQDDYIVHGEIEISRLNKEGNIKWQFSGSDIFVSVDSDDAFKLNADHIALTDFYKIKYKLDFNGKTI